MDRLQQDGLDILYIQWLQYGETNFLNAHIRTGELLIQVILDNAAAHGIGVYVGLFSDPSFFQSLNAPDPDLKHYLTKLREKSFQAARGFRRTYGNHAAFRGWYLPEEIDDLNWQAPDRKEMLSAHLQALESGLKDMHAHKPMAFSSFFTGASSPRAYARFCRYLLKGTDRLLLVQDGLGTGRMDLSITRDYHIALNHALDKSDGLHWVVELFNDELPGPDFSGKAVSLGQFNERLAIVHDDFKGSRLIAFSLRYWLERDAHLSQEYRGRFHKNQMKESAGQDGF